MKKLLGSAMALAFILVTSQANAELLKNFKLGGSVEVDVVSARNEVTFQKERTVPITGGVTGSGVAYDRLGTGQTRIMLNMDWDLLDDVHAKITLRKNNRIYGNASEHVNTLQNNLWLDQAYFKIDKVFGALDMTFGRQFFGEPGDLIAYYGPKYDEYGFNVTAIDGGRFDWNGEKVYATAVLFEPDANANAGAADPEDGTRADVRGFIVGNKGHENIEVKAYVWSMTRHGDSVAGTPYGGIGVANAESKNSNLYIPGLKVKAKFGGVYGSLEYAQNLGEDRTNAVPTNFKGRALLVNGGMKAEVEQIGTFNPWAEFGIGTGRANTLYGANETFMDIATDYHPGALYGRFNANNPTGVNFFGNNGAAGDGLSNRVIWGGGVKVTPSALNKLTAGVGFYDIRFHRIAFGNPSVTGHAAHAGNRHIGSEIDMTAEWKHSENVVLKGTVANFQPGGYIKNIVNAQGLGNHPSAAMLAAFDVSVKF